MTTTKRQFLDKMVNILEGLYMLWLSLKYFHLNLSQVLVVVALLS